MQKNKGENPTQSKILPVVVTGFALISLAIVTFWLLVPERKKISP